MSGTRIPGVVDFAGNTGRVARIDTVKVTDQFFVERYSHVMHIVSNVEGARYADGMRSTRGRGASGL